MLLVAARKVTTQMILSDGEVLLCRMVEDVGAVHATGLTAGGPRLSQASSRDDRLRQCTKSTVLKQVRTGNMLL